MCNRSNNINNSYNINQNTCCPTSRENILLERLQKYQEKDKEDLNESLTSFNIDCNNNLDRPLKTVSTKYGIISLEDTTIQDENNHQKEYDFKKIGQPVLGIFVAQNSNGSSKLKKNRLKRKFKRQYRTEIPRIMKRDASEMTESNNEKLNNYYPANYSSLNGGLVSVSKMKHSKNCHHCNSPSCPLNIDNNDSLIDKNPENYSNDTNEYSFKSIPYDNCTDYSYTPLVEKYPGNFDWTIKKNIVSSSNIRACCCSEKNETCFRECPPSKASLFVETGESMLEFSTSWSSNSNLPDVCPCSNESSMIEEHSTMNEDVELDDPFEKKEEHAMIDKCGARCKSRDFKHEPCCSSHFTSKKHSTIENSNWSQLEMVESKARRLDYGRRENIRWRDVGTSSNVRSVTKRPRCNESETDNTSEGHGISKNYQNSLFGDFEIGKVWSHVHDTCKNFVQSAVTNIGQTIKNISRTKDTPEDIENEISDYLSRKTKVIAGKECSKSCQERE